MRGESGQRFGEELTLPRQGKLPGCTPGLICALLLPESVACCGRIFKGMRREARPMGYGRIGFGEEKLRKSGVCNTSGKCVAEWFATMVILSR